MLTEPLGVITELGVVLDHLGIRWAVGGSVASSLHGVPRSTFDIDLVVAIGGGDLDGLAREASPAFMVDAEMGRDCFRYGQAFNILHEATMMKIDLFPTRTPFAREQLATAVEVRSVRVISPAAIAIAKLDWYRRGGEVSERQWRDVLGVLSIQHGRLDLVWMRRWAAELGVTDLLDRALADDTGGI